MCPAYWYYRNRNQCACSFHCGSLTENKLKKKNKQTKGSCEHGGDKPPKIWKTAGVNVWFVPLPLEVEKQGDPSIETTEMSAPWQHDKRVLSEGVCTQMHSKHGVGSEFGAGGGVWSGTSLLSLAHIFLCVCYNTAFVYGGQIEVHVGCPLVFYVIRLPSPTSLLSLERKQEKAIKQCWFKTPPVQGSSPFLFFGISTEVLLFCGSPGVFGCFFPSSFFQGEPLNCSLHGVGRCGWGWGGEGFSLKAVTSFLLCGEASFLAVIWCPPKGPGVAWRDWWIKNPCPQWLGLCLNHEASSPFSLLHLTTMLIFFNPPNPLLSFFT